MLLPLSFIGLTQMVQNTLSGCICTQFVTLYYQILKANPFLSPCIMQQYLTKKLETLLNDVGRHCHKCHIKIVYSILILQLNKDRTIFSVCILCVKFRLLDFSVTFIKYESNLASKLFFMYCTVDANGTHNAFCFA
jgi:hypothetical protein